MTEYLIFTIVTGAVLVVGTRIYINRFLRQLKERDDKFKAEIAKVRKMHATPAQ